MPEADIDASLLRRVEPFQMVQLVCRAARFWIAFVQACDPYLPHLKYRWTALRSTYAMITPGRHRPLAQDAWNESAVRVAIEKLRPMRSPISIPTPSGRLTRVTTGWE